MTRSLGKDPFLTPPPPGISLLARGEMGALPFGAGLEVDMPLPEAGCFAHELVFREQEGMTPLSMGPAESKQASRRLRAKSPHTDQFVSQVR